MGTLLPAEKVLTERSRELKYLQRRFLCWSIAATIWYTVPFTITFLSFLAYAATQQDPLTPSIAFTALSLFNLLKAPRDQLVGMLSRVQESLVSLGPVEKFLRERELSRYEQPHNASRGVQVKARGPLGFKGATLTWASVKLTNGSLGTRPGGSLLRINAVFVENRLNIIAGLTGSGKTSLLMALLGEMTLVDGTVQGPLGAVAYGEQESWLCPKQHRLYQLLGPQTVPRSD